MGMRMKRLRTLREERGLTREALARCAGVSSILIEKHERGLGNDTYVSVAVRLSQALDVPVLDLFDATDITGLRVKSGEAVA